MIVPMQKVTLFISAAYREAALEKLRSLGVVHVTPLQTPVSEDLTQLESELERVGRCQSILAEIPAAESEKNGTSASVVEKVLALDAERKQLLGKSEEKQALLDWFALWGKVSLRDVEELHTRGIFLHIYRTNRSVLANLPEDFHIEVLEDDKGQLRIALLGQSEEQRLDIKEELVPTETFEEVRAEWERIRNRRQEIDKELAGLASYSEDLAEYQSDLEKHREFARVASGMQAAEEICYLQGYCPDPKMSSLADAAEKEGWGLLSEEPGLDENPPTQLRMSRWSRIIKPVFEFLGTVPGYREFDISRYFLIFFSIFVAMIIGDAGYGAIFLLLSILAHRKSAKQGKPISLAIQLFYVLSICTVIWGAISGNWFGSIAIAGLPFFKTITIPQLATFPELFPELSVDPQQKVMLICFVIAIVHLGLANIINFINDFPRWKSFGHLGWFTIMAGLFLVVLISYWA